MQSQPQQQRSALGSAPHMRGLSATPIDPEHFPPELVPWLQLEDSMTAALAQRFGQEPAVEVHFSGADPLVKWETQLLNCAAELAGYARHISLNINAQPVLLARSVTLQGGHVEPLLSQLQTTPLARVLFEDALWQRVGAPLALRTEPVLFGRACVWLDQRSGEHLLVEEFFNFSMGTLTPA